MALITCRGDSLIIMVKDTRMENKVLKENEIYSTDPKDPNMVRPSVLRTTPSPDQAVKEQCWQWDGVLDHKQCSRRQKEQ